MDRIMEVYVPAEDSPLKAVIKQGSGIVGLDEEDEHVTIYYEGNVYGAMNLKTFKERIACAAGRLATKYPTVAKMRAKREELVLVGQFDYETRRLTYCA